MNKIPDRFPVVTADKLSICMYSISEMVIHLEMTFDQPLDVDRLACAFELVLDAEPILGCRLLSGRLKVWWERLPENERRNFTEAGSQADYEAFLAQPHQPEFGPQLKGCLWRDGRQDRLMLKIAHEASDAGGCKRAVAALSSIYRQLATDPDFLPQPNPGRRNIRQVLDHIPWYAFPGLYFNFLKHFWRIVKPGENFGLHIEGTFSGRPHYCLRHLPADQVTQLIEYGRRKKATINDLILTAYIRTIAKTGEWDGCERLQSGVTIDLRQYIPGGKAEAISTLSIVEYVFFKIGLNTDFPETLDCISQEMTRRKANRIGLMNVYGMLGAWPLPARWASAIFNRSYETMKEKRLYNTMTNMGPILPEHVTFDNPASAAYLIGPPVFPPYISLGLSGYSGSLTLSLASYSPAATPELLDGLLGNVALELNDIM